MNRTPSNQQPYQGPAQYQPYPQPPYPPYMQPQGKRQAPPYPPPVEAGTQRAAGPGQFATPGGQGIPTLEVQSAIHSGKLTYKLTKPVINIGRDPSNDIVIDAPVVSHFHTQIVREGDHLTLIHPHPSQPHTTNGLLYQGRHILGNEPFRKPLVRGDIFRIGDEHGALVTLTYNEGSGASQQSVPKIRSLPAGAPLAPVVLSPRTYKHNHTGSSKYRRTNTNHSQSSPAL